MPRPMMPGMGDRHQCICLVHREVQHGVLAGLKLQLHLNTAPAKIAGEESGSLSTTP